ASVASFFVSRVDTLVDKQLDEKIAAESDSERQQELRGLQGKAAIANARLAYLKYREIFYGDRFARLREQGATSQRCLWASTSTKNPAYRDVLYVEELIGPETVDTMPADHHRLPGARRRSCDGGSGYPRPARDHGAAEGGGH